MTHDNGLVLDPNTLIVIPSTGSSGSISNIQVKGTGDILDNNGKGELRNIVIGVFSRNYSEIDTWSEGPKFTTPIGRFIDSSFSDSTLLIENFDKETFRLKSSSISNLYLRGLSSTNLESLLVGDYNSVESIEDLGELQQIAGGILQYPDAVDYNDYSGVTITSPNSVSYTGNLDTNFPNRIYIRAFQFSVLDSNSSQLTFLSNDGGFSQPYNGINRFNVKITTDLSLAQLGHNGSNSPDISTSTVQSGDVSLDGIRIEVRLPGAINAVANTAAQSGTGWGVISNGFYGFQSVGPASGEVFGAFDTDFSNLLTKTGDVINIPVRIPGNYFLHNADGIVVVKVLMHSTFNGSIEKIELESR
jgi:hypothetical protein